MKDMSASRSWFIAIFTASYITRLALTTYKICQILCFSDIYLILLNCLYTTLYTSELMRSGASDGDHDHISAVATTYCHKQMLFIVRNVGIKEIFNTIVFLVAALYMCVSNISIYFYDLLLG